MLVTFLLSVSGPERLNGNPFPKTFVRVRYLPVYWILWSEFDDRQSLEASVFDVLLVLILLREGLIS